MNTLGAIAILLVAGTVFYLLTMDDAQASEAASEDAPVSDVPETDPLLAIERIDNAEAIARVRAAALAASPPMETWDEARLRQTLESSWSLDPDDVLAWHRALPDLAMFLDRAAADSDLDERPRTCALLALAALESPDFTPRFEAMLGDAATASIPYQVLVDASFWAAYQDFALPRVIAALLPSLLAREAEAFGSHDLQVKVLEWGLELDLEGAASRALEMLGALPVKHRLRLVRALGARRPSHELLAIVDAVDISPKVKRAALEAMLEGATGDLADQLLDRMIDGIEEAFAEGQQAGVQSEPLLSRWRAKDLDFLRRWSVEHRDTVTRGHLKVVLARLGDEETIARAAAAVATGTLREHDTQTAIRALGWAKADSGDRKMIDLLVSKTEDLPSSEVARAIARIGGPHADSVLPTLRARLDILERLDLEQLMGRRDIGAAAAAFMEIGIIDPANTKSLLDEKWDNESLSVQIFELLSWAKTLHWFDSEADVIPVDHTELLQEALSNTEIVTLEAVTQAWVSEADDKNPQMTADDSRLAYTVEAVVALPGGATRLYRFRCRDAWDYYDGHQVMAAANAMLADAKAVVRFMPIRAYGQDAAYLLARPEQITAAVAADWIAVEDSALRAVGVGRAFEAAAAALEDR